MADITKEVLDAITATAQTIGEPREVGGIKYAVIPQNAKVESLEKFQHSDYAERPHRKKGTVHVTTGDSFITYYQRFKDGDSLIFANAEEHSVTGIIDYHHAHGGAARWGTHRVRLDLQYTNEWTLWTEKNNETFTQREWAEFVEQNSIDIIRPDGATMLEMAQTLQAKTDVEFVSGINLQNGRIKFTYKEDQTAGWGAGNTEIPATFTLSVAVFEGMAPVEIVARLRYRLGQGGKLTFFYVLTRPNTAERNAFQTVADMIKAGTQSELLMGSV